jgi:uroporphyrinogen-III synthase
MRAVVTRPVEDAERLAAPLRARGVEVFVEPLLAVMTAAAADVSLDGVQAFLLTSANGARALAEALADRPIGFHRPALCVGDQTARVATELGFVRVSSAGGDVHSLAALVRDTLTPAGGALVHAAGGAVAGDLQTLLDDAGFTVHRRVLYETRPAKGFSEAFRTLLREGGVDHVFFYSPRTARTFADLASAEDLREACRGIGAYCLSQAVADALTGLPFRPKVAAEPTQDSLLAVFDEDNANALAGVSFQAAPSDAGRASSEGDGTMTERPKAGQTGQDKDIPASAKATAAESGSPDATPQESGTKESGTKAASPKEAPTKEAPAKEAPAKEAKEAPKTTPPATPPPKAAKATTTGPAKPATAGAPQTTASPKPAGLTSGGMLAGIVGLLVLLVILLAAWATLPLWRGSLPAGLRAATAPLVPGAAAADRVAGLEDDLRHLESRVGALSERVDALDRAASAAAPASAPASGPAPMAAAPTGDGGGGGGGGVAQGDLDALRERLDALAATQPADLSDEVAAVEKRVGELQASRAEASAVLNLSDRVAGVEEALRHQEARQARAVAVLVMVGQLRNAVDTGRPFADDLRSLRAVAPDDLDMAAATDGWAARAEGGVPTLTTLRQSFAAHADAIIRSSATDATAEGSWWARTVDRLTSVVSVRRTDGDAVGNGPAAVVSRAERDLDDGNLSAAVAEVATLDGPAAEVAADWLAGARARLAAETGLAALTGEALARLKAADVPAPAADPKAESGDTGREG